MECFKCRNLFYSTDELSRHFRFNHGLQPSGCELRCTINCPKTFLSFGKLKRHINLCHGDLLKAERDFKMPKIISQLEDVENEDLESVEVDVDMDETKKCINLEKSFMAFITSLASKANMTQSNVQMVSENLEGFVADVGNFAKDVFQDFCVDMGLDASGSACVKAFEKLNAIFSAITNVNTTFKRNRWLVENNYLIYPEEIVLGTRDEQRYSTVRKTMQTVTIDETYQIVPLDKLLATVIVHSNSIGLIRNSFASSKPSSTIKDYMSAQVYRTCDFFVRHPKGLVLHMFVDAFETCNPLGSHTFVHKLEGLYCIIANVPPEFNSKLSSIFLVGLWYAADVKKYGYDAILKPIYEQLKELESESGMQVEVNGETVQIHAILGMFSADNLGAHSLFGFLESFSANQFCRYCCIRKSESQQCFSCDSIPRRTKEEYNRCVSMIGDNHYNPSDTGIKRGCILNELQYFHCVDNSIVDCMHDLLEGIIPFEISLVLQSFIARRLLTLDEINQALLNFDYSLSDRNSKPPEITLPTLRIQAAEAWCLIRNLPLMIGTKIPRDDDHYRLLILLLDCCAIVFAPEITDTLAQYLSVLIEEHHTHFKLLYPDRNLLPKHHFLLHYPEFMVKFGPLCRFWCMRFEAKHRFGKELASVVRNFNNICKTIATRTQIALAHDLMSNNLYSAMERLGSCTVELIGNLKNAVGAAICEAISLEIQDEIFIAKSFHFGHYKIKPGCYVIHSMIDGVPQFGCIELIFTTVHDTYFVCRQSRTLYFDEHFYAFAVAETTKLSVIISNSLKDYHPLVRHEIVTEGIPSLYIGTRYKLF